MAELLWAPLLACLVLTAIHVYLGLHVLARGVIFVTWPSPRSRRSA
jgi:zinc/manganese transport system permease protein